MEMSLNYEDKVASIIKHFIEMAGFRKADRQVHWTTKLAFCCFLTTLITQVIVLFLVASDMKKLFESFSILTFCGMGALKFMSLHFSNQKWLEIIEQANNLEKEELSAEIQDGEYESDNETEQECFFIHIQTYSKQFRSLSILISRIYMFTLFVFIFSPFIERGFWMVQEVNTTGRPHILPGWAPLDEFGITGYLFTIVAELIAAIYCVRIHIAFDLTAFGLMIFLAGQFSSLQEFSEKIGGRGNYSKNRDERAHYRIIKCHKTLVNLESILRQLDYLIRGILGVYFFLEMLTLCSVALQLIAEDNSKMQLINLAQYTGASLTQLFLFCYYGDMVMNKSSVGTGQGPYAAAHWCISPRVRRELALLGVGMARKRRLRAGLFHTLDLPSFIQVIRATYSYYAVLRK